MEWDRKWLVNFNASYLFERSDNTGVIDVKMNGSVLQEKPSFKIMGLFSLLSWIGALTLSLFLKLPPRILETLGSFCEVSFS